MMIRSSSQLCRASSVCVQAKPLRCLRFAFVRAVIIELRPIPLTLLSATVLHHRILLYDKEAKGYERRSSVPPQQLSFFHWLRTALRTNFLSRFFASCCFTRVNAFSTYFIWSRREMNVFSDILSLPQASTLHLSSFGTSVKRTHPNLLPQNTQRILLSLFIRNRIFFVGLYSWFCK